MSKLLSLLYMSLALFIPIANAGTCYHCDSSGTCYGDGSCTSITICYSYPC